MEYRRLKYRNRKAKILAELSSLAAALLVFAGCGGGSLPPQPSAARENAAITAEVMAMSSAIASEDASRLQDTLSPNYLDLHGYTRSPLVNYYQTFFNNNVVYSITPGNFVVHQEGDSATVTGTEERKYDNSPLSPLAPTKYSEFYVMQWVLEKIGGEWKILMADYSEGCTINTNLFVSSGAHFTVGGYSSQFSNLSYARNTVSATLRNAAGGVSGLAVDSTKTISDESVAPATTGETTVTFTVTGRLADGTLKNYVLNHSYNVTP